MTTLLEKLIPTIDSVRGLPGQLGWYTRDIELITRVWPGARKQEGRVQDVTLAVVLTFSPRPRISDARFSRLNHAPGFVEDGDLLVRSISATHTEATLKGTALAANEERLYRITRVANDSEAAVKEATTGLFRLQWAWKRGDPIGWELLLRPVVA